VDTPITAGSILIQDGTLVPDSMHLISQPYSPSWTSVTNLDRTQLEGQLLTAGWTFFFMAGQITANAFGFDKEKRLRSAVNRAIGDARSQNCNCLAITGVQTKSFLGLPYVSVTAQSRHIQLGSQFRSH
jgi:hypothetical protein